MQPDDILIIRTDWTDRSWGKFPEFFTKSPYLTPEAADWVVELGPEGGSGGGRIVFEGTPAALRKARTATGKYLAKKR